MRMQLLALPRALLLLLLPGAVQLLRAAMLLRLLFPWRVQ
jgi:hypothetical protein